MTERLGPVAYYGRPMLLAPRRRPGTDSMSYVRREVDWSGDDARHSLWLVDLSGGAASCVVTDLTGTDYCWRGDGAGVYVVIAEDDGDWLTYVPLDGAPRRRLQPMVSPYAVFDWSDWHEGLLLLQALPGDEPDPPFENGLTPYTPAPPSTELICLDRAGTEPLRLDAAGGDDDRRHPILFAVDPASGCVALVLADTLDVNGAEFASGLRILPPPSGDGRRHIETPFNIERISWIAGTSEVLLIGTVAADGIAQPTLATVDVTSGECRRLIARHRYALEAAAAIDTRSVAFLANAGVRSSLHTVDLETGVVSDLPVHDEHIDEWSLDRAGGMLFRVRNALGGGDLWALDVRGNGERRRITTEAAAALERFALPRVERFCWRGRDGEPLDGILTLPPDGEPPYPCVIYVHGGPHDSMRFDLGNDNDHSAVTAAAGFAVLRPNYRASVGYGDAFMADVAGCYFNNMPGDVLSAADALVAAGVAIDDQFCLMGYSAGGGLTKHLIGVSNRFRAAAAGAGATDWQTLYLCGDLRRSRHLWFGGPPSLDVADDEYWRQSPLRLVPNVRTPTLMFYGENDERNPVSEGVQYHRALTLHGVPNQLYVAPGSGHLGWPARQLVHKCNLTLAWFRRWLGREPWVFDQPPSPGETPDNPQEPEQ